MRYNQLGSSALYISEIGFGCMSLSPGKGEDSSYLLHRAIEFGINYFDTADLYDKGLNETLVGKALRSKRDKLIIATKVGNQWRPDGSGWDWNPRKAYIVKAVEDSLRRLQTDRIDLYQLHGGTIEDPIDEVIQTFELLQHQGKIRYYGISSIRPNVIREYVKRSNIVSVMLQYSLADRRAEETVLNLLQENNIAVLSRGALAQGILVNKPAKEYLGQSESSIANAAKVIQSMTGNGLTAAQIVIQFVLQQPAITVAVTGISRVQQLEEIAAVTGNLSAEEMRLLRELLPAKTYEQHR